MKTAYFDCRSGIAGDMLLGALLDAGVSSAYLVKELKKLKLPFKLAIKKTKSHSLAATQANVVTKEEHNHTKLEDIIKIIKKSRLKDKIKKQAVDIFNLLANAEAKVHGSKIKKVHLHQAGSIDAIVDIVGTVICLDKLGIGEVYASSLNTGSGIIKHYHGVLPIPAPATSEILKGKPIYGTGSKELATPTGAAIISYFAKSFGNIPRMEIKKIGYGAGSYKLSSPNLLRVLIGENDNRYEEDSILQIETNIDDMKPEYYDRAIKKIMQAGALDAFITPIRMKKKRSAITLTALCEIDHKDKVLDAVFSQTTSIGARMYLIKREKLKRKIVKCFTKYGKLRVKLSFSGNELKGISPEFEDLKKIARKTALPIQRIYSSALESAFAI